MNEKTPISVPELDFNTPALRRNRKLRAIKDRFTTVFVGIGGMSVIVAILLIFVYLMYEVLPLFQGADITPWEGQSTSYQVGSDSPSLHLGVEEQNEVGFKLNSDGSAYFFATQSGQLRLTDQLAFSEQQGISAFALDTNVNRLFGAANKHGEVLIAQPEYDTSYPTGTERLITPSLIYPYGNTPIALPASFGEPTLLAIRDAEDALVIVAANASHELVLVELSKDQNFMTEEVTLSAAVYALPTLSSMPFKILITPDQRWVMAVDRDANLSILDIKDRLNPRLNAVHKLSDYALNDVQLLLGGSTLMVADVSGAMSQWFMIRDQNNHWALAHIRDFDQQDGPQLLAMEHRRRGFATGDPKGNVAFFSATAGVQVHKQRIIETPIQFIAMSPRANAMLVENNAGHLSFWQVDNKHPDTSWKALWHKIWYEGYENPEYIWQSSASSNDFEPKYSLMPLAFGTLKSAFYAMLMATPLAICGAIYTAYFMAPALRRKVKPLIELMEALPTVILGFLAGLWLAPFIETNLASVFTLFVVVPFGTLLFAYLWAQLPKDLGWQLPVGWDVLIIIPVVLALAWLSMPISDALEASLFGGNMRQWVSRDLGINFDQRNALVVGIAMGFAVIPTIFSITEDAIFSVPKHLTQGSLALGATPWQTLTRVVIPTASPGIFSAVMIGMGRAVGETMIVLMATGNTPIMDMNIFEGMRTLAANIAVEMPESEVGGSHFRILFLAALVLFAFTFMVNTLAEVVRQRLRQKYGSL